MAKCQQGSSNINLERFKGGSMCDNKLIWPNVKKGAETLVEKHSEKDQGSV